MPFWITNLYCSLLGACTNLLFISLCSKIFAAIRAAEEELRKKREAGHKVKLEYIQQGKRSKDESVVSFTIYSQK